MWMSLRRVLVLFAAGLGLTGAACGPVHAEPASSWSRNDHAAVRLVSAVAATGTAERLRLGLQFQLAPGWKIYWRSPGDAGFPPRIDWSGSDNLARADIRWPAPVRFELFGLETFGYGGEIVLPIDVTLQRPGEPLRLDARVDYLVCEKICIPYQADLALVLPAGPARPGAFAHLIDRFNARVPGDGTAVGLAIERVDWLDGAEPQLIVAARSVEPFTSPDVLVEAPGPWSFGRPVPALRDGGRAVELRVPVRLEATDGMRDLVGRSVTLTLIDGGRAAERTLGVGRRTAPAATGFLGILALAVLGGLILNVMPCVMPVLSLKLLNVVAHAGAAQAAIRRNFVASAAGIVASFLVLAAALAGLKTAGLAVGWGIQFQQPLFLVFLIVLLAVFAANLWGWFEIRVPGALANVAARAGGTRGAQDDVVGSFLTGALATLLATPCSAPFLGTAIGFALAAGPAEIFAVFAAVGAGLALPYLAVALVPRLARLLPRPGAWMVVLRRLLGVALLGTAVWLLSILVVQIGTRATLALASVVVLLLAFLWVVREAGESRRWLRPLGLVALGAVAFATPLALRAHSVPPSAAAEPGWRGFDRGEIDRLVADGRVVFVDVTADWCITCQANKTLVLSRGEVARRLAGEGPEGTRVVAMRADWTLPDPRIADYLASFGRYGIPFNVVYGPGAPAGIVLPELLSSDVVLAALDRAAGRADARADPAR